MELNYPAGPQAYPEELVKATPAYRRHAWVALLALLSFVVFYLSLSSWLIWKSYALIRASSRAPNDGVWLFLGGLAAGFIALFMLKAIWFVKRTSTDGLAEVKQDEQPELFAFLYRLADEARAPRPRKVFLSARVNAAVFYDLTLLNLVFPSRKNLEIGLPLVNVLNASEFKAVLAHEFGHFAQRSMAVGRWVYIAQQIAGHVVAKRDSLDAFLRGLSRIDVRIAWIGWVLSVVVWAIRSIVDTFFKVVLAAERALSREMEFQADRVSVSLTGSDALINALYRCQSADTAWDRALAFVNAEVKAGRVTADLFEIQSLIIVKLRDILDDPTFGDPARPNGDPAAHRVFERQAVQGSRMWASHPLNHEREANAKQIYLPVPLDEDSAWTLFRNPEALKLKQCADMVAPIDPPLPVASREESLAALELEYGRESYKRIYRGCYLSRSVTRHAAQVHDLYADEGATLAAIYPDSLQSDLRQLDVLQSERAQLTAIKDGTAKSVDGLIRFRGDTIKRKEIGATLRTIGQEIEVLNGRLVAHDCVCRTAARAQAGTAGEDWDAYLRGLLSLVRYTEHMQANIADAHGALANVVAMATAKRKVSDDERIRIVNAGADLYRLLQEVDTDRSLVIVDEATLKLAGVADWTSMLETFTLGAPGQTNIGDWIKVIDGWVQSYNPALSRMRRAALDQLLVTENRLHAVAGDREKLGAAPTAPSVPADYSSFTVGQERPLQKKLDWWSRFQVADGWVPGTARFLVAGGIIGGVMGMSASVGTATLWIHNGLDRSVTTSVGAHALTLSPGATDSIHLDVDDAVRVTSRAIDGKEIESFKETPDIISGQYVYNIAQASPLVEWTVGYGNSSGSPAREVNYGRWFPTSVQVVLAEPPHSIQTKAGGGTRTVISAPPDTSLHTNLGNAEKEQTRNALILAHARWDAPDSVSLMGWLALASSLPDYPAILKGRLSDNPLDIASLRFEQEIDGGHSAICARQTALATQHAENADLQYLAVRCMELGPSREAAFKAGYKKYPDNGWFAYAAGYDFASIGNWSDASKAYGVALRKSVLAEKAAVDLARVRRLVQGANANVQDILAKSAALRTNRFLETGEGMSDGDPAKIYFDLNRGQVDEAAKRWKGASGNERALRLIAASEGAPADLVERSLTLAPKQGIDGDVFWSALGLALRHQRNVDPLLAQLKADPNQESLPLRKFVEIMQTTRDTAQADKALENVPPQMRAQAYVVGVIVLGRQAPAAWRDFAKKALLVTERPYLG
jgi:Zn-dependent protease with chaperone function